MKINTVTKNSKQNSLHIVATEATVLEVTDMLHLLGEIRKIRCERVVNDNDDNNKVTAFVKFEIPGAYKKAYDTLKKEFKFE